MRTSSAKRIFPIPMEPQTSLSYRRADYIYNRYASTETSPEASFEEASKVPCTVSSGPLDETSDPDSHDSWFPTEYERTVLKLKLPGRASTLSRTAQHKIAASKIYTDKAILARLSPVVVGKPALAVDHGTATREVRKHFTRRARQAMHMQARLVQEAHVADWHEVVNFMSKHTPQFGELFNFKVVLGRGIAYKVEPLLSRRFSNITQLQQQTKCVIRAVQTGKEDGVMVLSLTGPEIAIRKVLMQVARRIGKFVVFKALDLKAGTMLRDIDPPDRLSIKVLGARDAGPSGDNVLTIETDVVKGPAEYYPYLLTKRADAIKMPSEWTTASLEAYVASLVYGEIPRHLVSKLYSPYYSPDSPQLDHHDTVAILLVRVFRSQRARHALSSVALKMALSFLERHKKREFARVIFNLAEKRGVTIDADIYNLFLEGCSRTRDLSGFHDILKMMVVKGCQPDGRSWVQLLFLAANHEAKEDVWKRMKSKGLNRVQSVHLLAGRHMIPYRLERKEKGGSLLKEGIQDFVDSCDKTYGRLWLDVGTLNRMIHTLGRNGRLDACYQLLGIAKSRPRLRATNVTLHTMITHCKRIPEWINIMASMRKTWPISLDRETYGFLFRIAWKKNLPNLLRVIICYGALNRALSYEVRRQLHLLLLRSEDLDQKFAFFKPWEAMLVGRSSLVATQGTDDKAKYLAWWFGIQSSVWRPMASLEEKLAEAYEMDRRIKRIPAGTVMTAADVESFTVKILLVPRIDGQMPPPLGGDEAGSVDNKKIPAFPW